MYLMNPVNPPGDGSRVHIFNLTSIDRSIQLKVP